MNDEPFEDVIPIKHGDSPLPCDFPKDHICIYIYTVHIYTLLKPPLRIALKQPTWNAQCIHCSTEKKVMLPGRFLVHVSPRTRKHRLEKWLLEASEPSTKQKKWQQK